MNDILCRQMALDYCCSPEDVLDGKNHFTEHSFLEGRRRYREGSECFLKIAVINGKLLFTGHKEIIGWCRNKYENDGAAWFLEAGVLRVMDERLRQSGYRIGMVHPFFIPGNVSGAVSANAALLPGTKASKAAEAEAAGSEKPGTGFSLRWYHGEEIEQFRGDPRFPEAYTFCEEAPDVIGVGAVSDESGEILGMAGASCDSPTMWQIGINVDPQNRRAGIAKLLVGLLKDKILERGILPYYGTSISHLASQRVALGTGFVPAWVELTTSKM